jgi:23S rRNA (cytidine1920-2'-O)/16S rRNA (cytidine1409-2'-O)-methyltransferase
MKSRLDILLAEKGLVESRSQAENLIKLGEVLVDGKIVNKPGYFVKPESDIKITANDRYVSRAGLKLASVAMQFKLDFKNKVVLDVGSSTGGFTDYALQNGAKKVIAVDVGTNQLHHSLQSNDKIELFEKTDIRDIKELSSIPNIVVVDVSFVSLKSILPAVIKLSGHKTQIVTMLKPQFEAGASQKHKGVIKNEKLRRKIIANFETWAKQYLVIVNKLDSGVKGARGNQERFYLLNKITKVK